MPQVSSDIPCLSESDLNGQEFMKEEQVGLLESENSQQFAHLFVQQRVEHLVEFGLGFLALLVVYGGDAGRAGEHVLLVARAHPPLHHPTDPLLLRLRGVLHERLAAVLIWKER